MSVLSIRLRALSRAALAVCGIGSSDGDPRETESGADETDVPTDGPPDRDSLELANDELNLRRASLATRWSSADTKSALLITASGLVVGFQVRADISWLSTTSAAVAFVASLVGIVGLWPRQGEDMDASKLRRHLVSHSVEEALAGIVAVKARLQGQDEAQYGKRAKVIRVGFFILVLSVLFAMVAVIVR